MKKIKQILTILGIVLLVGLYLSTLVCALSKSPDYERMLSASVYATVIIPVLIWAYSFIYKLLKKHNGKDKEDSSMK